MNGVRKERRHDIYVSVQKYDNFVLRPFVNVTVGVYGGSASTLGEMSDPEVCIGWEADWVGVVRPLRRVPNIEASSVAVRYV